MGNLTPDFPEFPESEGLKRLQAIAEQILREHDVRMAKVRSLFEDSGLADLQRATEAIQEGFRPAQEALDSIFTPQLQATLRDVVARNETLFAQVRSSVAPEVVAGILEAETPRVTAHLSGEVTVTSQVSGEVTVNPAPAEGADGGKSRYTPEQIAAAVGLLLSVHATTQDLRDGDLVNAATLAFLIAVALLVLAINTDPDA